MREVKIAQPYTQSNLDSRAGEARYMLLQQSRFPLTYEDNELLLDEDHDQLLDRDYDHTNRYFIAFAGDGNDLGLETKFRTRQPKKIMAFLRQVLKADQKVTWTGFRVLASVNRKNGQPIWHLQLFAKQPGSSTAVYTGDTASNVLAGI